MNEFSSTDEKIIKATFGILQKEGFVKATTKRIAAEAGVNEVTIFRNFQNKNNLIEITKNYYLQSNFVGLLNLSDEDFSIIKVAMEEVREIPEKKQLIAQITDTIIDKLDEFFKCQIENGKIRDVDSRVLAVMCFSVTFQSVVLWKIYDEGQTIDGDRYGRAFLDILYNGIKA